jgi:hypothetical protein
MVARATIVLSLLASVEAFSSSSPLGRKLLSKARQLNNNQEVDMSWIPNYSIRFEKCHSLVQVAGEGNGNGNNQQGGIIYTQQLAEFSLCPSDSCTTGTSSCKNGAKYIVNLREFAQLYLQYKQDELDYACETIRQNCNNDDQDACYSAAGMDQCIEVEGQEQDDMDRYMQCDVSILLLPVFLYPNALFFNYLLTSTIDVATILCRSLKSRTTTITTTTGITTTTRTTPTTTVSTLLGLTAPTMESPSFLASFWMRVAPSRPHLVSTSL